MDGSKSVSILVVLQSKPHKFQQKVALAGTRDSMPENTSNLKDTKVQILKKNGVLLNQKWINQLRHSFS